MAETKLTLKLLINSQTNTVLFAEANKDTVDFLSHLLSLPVSVVIEMLHEQGMIGCLPNLYDSIGTTSITTYIQSGNIRDSFLNIIGLPVASRSSPVSLMILDERNENYMFYKCMNNCYSPVYSNDQRANCPKCKGKMSLGMKFVAPAAAVDVKRSDEGGIVQGSGMYIIADDLVIEASPQSAVSSLALMNKFNVKDISILKEEEVHLGRNEALKLLKASLQSKKVLTQVFEEQLKEDLEKHAELGGVWLIVYWIAFSLFIAFIATQLYASVF